MKINKSNLQSILATLSSFSTANQHVLHTMKTIQAEMFAMCDPEKPETQEIYDQARQLGNLLRSSEKKQESLDANIRILKEYTGKVYGKKPTPWWKRFFEITIKVGN